MQQTKQATERQPKVQTRKERKEEREALTKHTKPVRVEYFKGYRL